MRSICMIDNDTLIANESGVILPNIASVEEINGGTSTKLVNVKNLMLSNIAGEGGGTYTPINMIPRGEIEEVVEIDTVTTGTGSNANRQILAVHTKDYNGWVVYNIMFTGTTSNGYMTFFRSKDLYFSYNNTTIISRYLTKQKYTTYGFEKVIYPSINKTPLYHSMIVPFQKNTAYYSIIQSQYNATVKGSITFIKGVDQE